jgi:ribonuclease HI
MVSGHDIVKYMLHKLILSGRMGKWAYSVIEYDLKYEPLRATKGQVIADLIVDHMVSTENDAHLAEVAPWKLFFYGSVCSRGKGVGCVLVLPHGVCHEFAMKLEFACTNNQAEYEGLLHGLELLKEIGVKKIEALEDSNLVVQQIKGESQCLNGTSNGYRDQCLDIIHTLDSFKIRHIPREDNWRANALAQQASGYKIRKGLFMIKENPAIALVDATGGESVRAVEVAAKTKPTKLPGAGGRSAEEENEMARPTEQPCTGDVSANRANKTTKPIVLQGTGGMSATEIGDESKGENQCGPVTHGHEEVQTQTRESTGEQNGSSADWR